MLNGIDVSGYQPANIGDLVPYDLLIAKATEGSDYVSREMPSQIGSALDRGKLAGIYHFAGGSDVSAEVSAFARAFEPYAGRAVPILDWEGYALAAGPAWRQAWLDEASRTLGIRPVLYGSLSVVQGLAETLWIAAYGANPVTNGYQTPASVGGIMRQYTSRGILPGYGGFLDLNAYWGTPEQWATLTGSKPAPIKRKRESVFIFVKPVDGNGTIWIRNTLNGKEVGIRGMQHLAILMRYTGAEDHVEGMLQAELDICEWYLAQLR